MAVETYKSKIVKIVQETPLVKTYFLELGSKEMSFMPGQFVMLEFAKKLPGIRRAYSISSSPMQKNTITVTIKKVGVFSTAMDESEIGEDMIVKGPLGHFVLEDSENDFVFIAGGAGITPFHSMIRYVLEKGLKNKMTLFYSSRTPDEFIFFKELNELAKNPQLKVFFTATRCTDPDWTGFREHINADMIKEYVKNYKDSIYYLCGPLKMVEEIEIMLQVMGIDKKKILAEKWG